MLAALMGLALAALPGCGSQGLSEREARQLATELAHKAMSDSMGLYISKSEVMRAQVDDSCWQAELKEGYWFLGCDREFVILVTFRRDGCESSVTIGTHR
jgi:hypothetical protein